jgi:hypothetical protein
MKNSLFWPFHKFEVALSKSFVDIEGQIVDNEHKSFFNLSIIKSEKNFLKLSFNIMFIQLLQLDLEELRMSTPQNLIEIKVRFSNILLLVYLSQLVIAILCCIGAFLFLNDSIIKNLLMILPFIIYFVLIINFKFFRSLVVKKIIKQGLLFKLEEVKNIKSV